MLCPTTAQYCNLWGCAVAATANKTWQNVLLRYNSRCGLIVRGTNVPPCGLWGAMRECR